MAVSNLDMHALFVLGDLRAKLVKQFQSRFVYITEQNAEGIYIAEIDTESALVVDDKPGLKLKVGDHFSASVLPSREGGKLYSGVNILGVIPGTRVTDRYIVVTAHYDHVGISDGLIYNGADDNASGVATMLELATRLKAEAPEHSVIFVAFEGEERGLLGAKHFVEAPPVPLSSIILNVNYDMTARAETDGKLWVTGTYQHPALRPLLEPVPARGPISLAFGKDTPQDTGSDNWVEASDHGAFFRAQVPFLYFGVDYHPDYHRPSDDFERITPAVFANATDLAIDAFRALDRGLSR